MAAAEPWWNIWTLKSPQAEEIVPHTIQSATEPKQGGQWHGETIYTVNGPYKTQAEAEAAIGQHHGPAPGSTGAGGVSNPLAAIGKLVEELTHPELWRSLGWLALGIILMIGGIVMWLKKSGAIPDVVPVPV